MALWLDATLEGVGSARALDRLCKEHIAYLWILGGVTVNYHTLADFRVKHEKVLNRLLTQSVAALMEEGLVSLKRTAQDGVRIRASAGGKSFVEQSTLERYLEEAEEQVRSLLAELEADPGSVSRRERGARERARQNANSALRRHWNTCVRWVRRSAGAISQWPSASLLRFEQPTPKRGLCACPMGVFGPPIMGSWLWILRAAWCWGLT